MIQFDLSKTFWSCNPQYKGFDVFKDLYEKDHTANRKDSSMDCWAAALFCSINSECINLEEGDRMDFIDASIYGKALFRKRIETIRKLVEVINKLEETPAARQLKLWNRIMDEKNQYMSELSYKTHHKALEDMMLSNGKLMAEYERICSILAKEEASERTRGGSKESLQESGMLDVN